MKKWLTSLFLVLTLSAGVLAGMPLHAGNMNSKMMKCCQKAKSKERSPEATAARLCCAFNCSNTAPNSSGSSFNFSPSKIIVSNSILKQIALLIERKKPIQTITVSFERKIFSPKFQPKYIQHHSFLI